MERSSLNGVGLLAGEAAALTGRGLAEGIVAELAGVAVGALTGNAPDEDDATGEGAGLETRRGEAAGLGAGVKTDTDEGLGDGTGVGVDAAGRPGVGGGVTAAADTLGDGNGLGEGNDAGGAGKAGTLAGAALEAEAEAGDCMGAPAGRSAISSCLRRLFSSESMSFSSANASAYWGGIPVRGFPSKGGNKSGSSTGRPCSLGRTEFGAARFHAAEFSLR
jgi:hypothetical protein